MYLHMYIIIQDEVLTVFDKVGLSSDEVCNLLLGDSCAKGYDPWHQQWNVTIPGNKPPVTHIAPKVRVQIVYTILQLMSDKYPI